MNAVDANDQAVGSRDTRMGATLHNALRMPRLSRTVSDFLFDGILENVFHRDYALAPAALTTSLTFEIKETVCLDPASLSSLPQAWSAVWGSDKNRAGDCGKGVTVNVYLLIMYVPVVSVPPYVMGYAWFAKGHEENQFCFPASPFVPPVMSRYVFDTRTGEALLVACGGRPACIGFHWLSANPLSDNCSHCVFGVPAAPYEWPYLPTTVIWMMSTITLRDWKLKRNLGSTTLSVENNVNTGQLDDETQMGTTSHVPWRLDAAGALPDGTIPMRTLDGAIENSALEVTGRTAAGFLTSALQASLTDMVNLLSGSFDFYGIKFDTSVTKALGADMPPAVMGQCSLLQSPTDRATSAHVRERFALVYYMSALSTTADAPLLAPPAPSLPSPPSSSKGVVSAQNVHPGVSPLPYQAEARGDVKCSGSGDIFGEVSVDDDFWINLPEGALLLDSAMEPWVTQDCDDRNITLTSCSAHPPSTIPMPLTKPPHTLSCDLGNIGHASSGITQRGDSPNNNVTLAAQPYEQWDVLNQNANIVTDLVTSAATTERVVPLAPRPAPLPQQNQEHTPNHLQQRCITEEQARHEQAQARRMRNRISAARSNARKKESLENLQRETEESKRKLAELTARKSAILLENKRLKAQLLYRYTSSSQTS